MSLTQIPLEPPAERLPEQGDLFDSQTWESAYREMHDFPTLLIQARDELARSRKREAFWISLIGHIVLILIIVNSPSLEKYLPHRAVMMVNGKDNSKLTFLELPPDAQKITQRPKTNVMSAGRAIDQAARQAAVSHGRYGGDNGDLGLGQRQPTARVGPYEITSDTMGVDFGPYMQRILHDVKQNWYHLIPESAMPPLLKKGKRSTEL